MKKSIPYFARQPVYMESAQHLENFCAQHMMRLYRPNIDLPARVNRSGLVRTEFQSGVELTLKNRHARM